MQNLVNHYSFLFTFFLIIFLVTFILIAVCFFLFRKQFSRSKLSSYECGFESFNDARRGFYVNFYNLGLMFLLFDVEIILIVPSVYSLNLLTDSGFLWLLFFVFVLAIGYVYEVITGTLKIWF